jgi:hypothetical protein
MRINPTIYGVMVVVVFFGVIIGFQAAGIWSTSGKVTANGEAVQPSASDPNSLKGWMTLDQVAATYNVSLEQLISQFNLPAETTLSTALKDLESDTFDTTALKEWLWERMNQDATASAGEEESDSPDPGETAEALMPLDTLVPAEHSALGNTVTGKTTIQNLLDWGLTEESIKQILRDDLPAPSILIKVYANLKGLEFSTLKVGLQAELDRLAP